MTYTEELKAVLEELASAQTRELTSIYGAAISQAAVIVELRKLRAAIEKSNKGPAAQRAKRRQKRSNGQAEGT